MMGDKKLSPQRHRDTEKVKISMPYLGVCVVGFERFAT